MITGDKEILNVLDIALEEGYRLIDTATVYGNEKSIGRALKVLLPKHKLKREEIFITSKLAPKDQGPQAYNSVKTSLEKLDCEYLDLYLIHWPGSPAVPPESPDNFKLRDQSWNALTKAVKEGLVKNIGVSNYTEKHLHELLDNNHGVLPVVNQVECHPKLKQSQLKDLCQREQILLQAYSSLGGTNNKNFLLNDPAILQVSEKINKTPAQVLLRWALQQNIAIIPKGSTKEHIEENFNLDFDLNSDMLNFLNNLPQTTKVNPVL